MKSIIFKNEALDKAARVKAAAVAVIKSDALQDDKHAEVMASSV